MNVTTTVEGLDASRGKSEVAAASIPWFVWTSILSTTSILVGGYWDISWHMSIGRDSFWTPAHLAIQFGGVLAGVSCGYLVFSTTFRRVAPLRDASIRVWGLRGPLGAFVSAWGGATMVVSAPFDNWWHNAYGLDVKILSPPHAVLNLGILGVSVGGLLLVLGAMNRATGIERRRLRRLVLLLGGELLIAGCVAVLEYTFRINLHRAAAYRAIALVAPALMLAVGVPSAHRWASTTIAAIYSVFLIAMLWLFPLFPAEPKLGPVYQQITHFIPLEFPLLLLPAAFAMDLIRHRTTGWLRPFQAIALGPAFVGILVAVEWPFADFLMSPGARNWVFGAHYFPYFFAPWFHAVRFEMLVEPFAETAKGLGVALVEAIASSWLGLLLGDFFARVRR